MRRGFPEVVLIAAVVSCSQQRTGGDATRFEDCMLGGPSGVTRVQARCTTFDGLHVAVLPAEGGRRAVDPMFFIPGGPGQGGFAAFAQVAGAFALVRRHRDIVVVEPRGVGKSEPLTCTGELPDDLRSEDALSRLKACAAELGDKPSFIGTIAAVRDLEMVRGALGYGAVDVYAASYGTRVALQWARERPDLVRAMVLDGVVAPETSLGIEQVLATANAFASVDARCSVAHCRDDELTLANVAESLRAELASHPVILEVRDPGSGEQTTVRLDDRQFEDTLRMMLYQSELVALLPKLLDDAKRGNLVPFATRAAMMRTSFEEAVNPLVYLSVVCAEDIPFLPSSTASHGLFRARVDELVQACKHWPVKPADAALKRPVDTDVPMLLVSGSADPVTPPGEADKVAAHARAARSIVLEAQGHLGVVRGCMPRLIADFFDTANAGALDASCAARIKPLPLFHGGNGP